jgi:citrate synthase
MLSYIMILCLEVGLSMPAAMSRMVARSKTFLTQACGASILAFGHAYGAFSAFGNLLLESLEKAEKDGRSPAEAADELVRENLDNEALGVSDLMLKNPAAKRLLTRAEKLGVAGKYIAFYEEIVRATQEQSVKPVDVDLLGAIGATMLDLGFTPEATWAIVAITRSFGAGAHYIEEVEREGTTRFGEELSPPELYDGPPDRTIPPLAERSRIARPAQTHTLAEWKAAFEERKKLFGSGFSIIEEIEDPSKKTGIKKVGG